MKIAVRRKLAVGVLATSTALIAGVVVAPTAAYAANIVSIDPNFAFNNDPSEVLTIRTQSNFSPGSAVRLTRPNTTDTLSGSTSDTSLGMTSTSEFNFLDTSSGANDGPANPGQYNATITDPRTATVDACQLCFTVFPSAPIAVSSLNANALAQGDQANVTVTGNGFARGTRIEVLLPSGAVDPFIEENLAPTEAGSTTTCLQRGTSPTCTVEIANRTTPTTLLRRFDVKAEAVTGPRNVRVTNTDGSTATCNGCFTVNGAGLTTVSPSTVDNSTNSPATATVTFGGPNVPKTGRPTLVYVGADSGSATKGQLTLQPIEGTISYGANTVTATYEVRDAAPSTNGYQPVLTQADGSNNTCTCRFTVAQGTTPTVTSLDPKTLGQSDSRTVTIRGTNFSRGVAFTVSGTGVTVASVEFISSTEVRANIQTAANATPGNRDVTPRLTNGRIGTLCSGCLTVVAGSASPSPSPSSSSTGTATLSRYVGLASPVRALDTRANSGPRRQGLITVDLSSQITDPNATAAVLNVTVTNGSRRGFLVAYPDGTTKPGTSNVNFEGQTAATATRPASAGTQANEVVVRLPANRRVSLFVDSAQAHVIADLVGSFTSTANTGGRVTTQAPFRALDTRSTSTPTRRGEVVLDLTGRLPATATAAILNVTVTRTDARGFVTVFPTGTTRPGTSNVNFERGQTQANEVTTQVGTGSNANKVSLFVDSANASVIVDVVGAVTPARATGTQVFTALTSPERAIDTRLNNGQRRSGNVVVQMPTSVPSDATGVILNVTATNGTRAGFLTVFPAGQSNPGTSNVNFPTNLTQANEVVSALGSNRAVTVFVGGANTPAAHVIVDVVGFLTPQEAPSSSASPSASASASPSRSPGILPIG